MKKIYTLYLLLLFSFQQQLVSGQAIIDCGSSRYDQEIFSAVTITSDIVYGSNYDYNGTNVSLLLDVYEPTGDTAAVRPLIIWAHGGSFVSGTKNDVDVVSLSNHFAKRGYVCASINYRLGMSVVNQATATDAVYRAVQDMKAAIRFFRKDAAVNHQYKIDPAIIFVGGSSAGAFTALQLAYMDQYSELPATIDTSLLGNMEGNSGNPGYSTEVNAVVNLCGALGDHTWMHPGDEPLCSMHGTNDQTVPYATAMIYLFNIVPIMVVDGSYSINNYADSIGLPNVMYTWFGAGHVPYASNVSYMDTTVRFVSNFLYRNLGCTPLDPAPLPNTFPQVGIYSPDFASGKISIYPVPATQRLIVDCTEPLMERLQVCDLSGRIVREVVTGKTNHIEILRDGLDAGFYLLRIMNGKEEIVSRIIFN